MSDRLEILLTIHDLARPGDVRRMTAELDAPEDGATLVVAGPSLRAPSGELHRCDARLEITRRQEAP